MPTERIELLLSRKAGEQINHTFQFLRENARTLWRAALYIAGPSTLLTGVFLGYNFIGSVAPKLEGTMVDPALGALLGLFFGAVTMLLLQGVANEYLLLYRERRPEDISVDDVWRGMRGHLGKLIGTTIVVALIYVGGYFGLAMLGAFGGVFLVMLGVLALFIPAIYATVPFSILFAVRIHEGKSIGNAITRSFELVKGYWWSSFVVIFLLGLIAWYMAAICVFPSMIVLGAAGVFNEGDRTSSLRIVILVVLAFGSVLSYMAAFLPTLGAALNYFNLVEKHEGTGMLARIDSIGTPEEENPLAMY